MKLSSFVHRPTALAALLAAFVAAPALAEFTCELSFPSAPATPLENFPVLVRLANDAPEGFLYEDCPTAAHLWFTDAGNNVLPFEADTWNTAGESLVWVSVPSFSSSTTITMHWSSDAGSVEDSPDAREVWTRAGYNAVWHFSGSNAESVTNLLCWPGIIGVNVKPRFHLRPPHSGLPIS